MRVSLAALSDQIGRPHAVTKPRSIYERYDQYFYELADRPVTLLELGFYTGESLKVFASFFPRGRILGIDNEDRGADFSGYPNVVIARCDQRDAGQLTALCRAHPPGGLDIVIDDAAHRGAWSWQSYQSLFPLLNAGAYYVVEDWLTGYWDDWADGSRYQDFPVSFSDGETPKRLPSHDFGMVGFVTRLIDEVAWGGIRSSMNAPLTRPPRLASMHVDPTLWCSRRLEAPPRDR